MEETEQRTDTFNKCIYLYWGKGGSTQEAELSSLMRYKYVQQRALGQFLLADGPTNTHTHTYIQEPVATAFSEASSSEGKASLRPEPALGPVRLERVR